MAEDHGITCRCGQTFQNPENLTKHVQLQSLELQNDYETRKPTKDELEKITEWHADTFNTSYEEAVGTINQCYYIIIDSYATGCPGYAGKLLIEIGSAGPGLYTVYTWNNNQIQRQDRATELQR